MTDIIHRVAELFVIDNLGVQLDEESMKKIRSTISLHLTKEMISFLESLSPDQLETAIMGEHTEMTELLAPCPGLNDALNEVFFEEFI